MKRRYPVVLSLFLLVSLLLSPHAAAAEWAPLDPAAAAYSPSLRELRVEATAALLVDQSYGRILYEQDARTRRYPASITKVMTCLLALEAVESGVLDLDEPVTAGADLYTGIGSGGSTQNLKEGEILTVRDLLYCALLSSANEACNVLAAAVSGSIPAFVAHMNQRAAQLGMVETRFTNTHGYHDEGHYTTAYDICLMVEEALRHPLFREIVSSPSYLVPATALHKERELKNTNALLNAENAAYYCPDAIGVKTGSTPEAGYCLASAAERDGHLVLCVVLGAQRVKGADGVTEHRQFAQSRRLLEWGLDNFSMHTLATPAGALGTAAVTLSKQADRVELTPTSSLTAFLPDDLEPGALRYELDCPDTVEAPVEAGQVLGAVTISCGDTVYGTLELAAAQSASRSLSLYLTHRLSSLYARPWVKALLLGALVLLFLLVRRVCFPKREKTGARR